MGQFAAQLLKRFHGLAFPGAVACAVFLAYGATQAQASHNGMPRAQKHGSRHVIDQLEEQWRNAVLKGNTAALNSLLADDYMAVTSYGTLQTRDEALASIRSGQWHFSSLYLLDRKVRFYGRTALVTSVAEVEGTTPEGDISGSYRYTRVYVQDPRGNWKIVSFEASRIRDPDEHSQQ